MSKGYLSLRLEQLGERNYRVKYAFRTPPTDSSDSGWQFLCDKKSHSGKDAKVISADELVHLIPSGASILETPPQCAFVFERNCWHRRQYPCPP